jgi:hypothetical protein
LFLVTHQPVDDEDDNEDDHKEENNANVMEEMTKDERRDY